MELDVTLTISVKLKGSIDSKTEINVYVPHLNKEFEVSIPNSITESQSLRLKGLGYTSSDGKKGDLYLKFDSVDKAEVKYNTEKCHNCGHSLAHGAKFCFECGSPVSMTNNNTQRKTVYDGEIHKCPNCGDIMEPFEIKCNVCGYDRRNAQATNSVKEFELKFEQAKSVEKKIDLIKTFAVPNAQEDLLEFAVLAAMNIDFDAYRVGNENSDDIRLSNAWLAKLEQAHEKAQVLFGDTQIWEKIHVMYEKRVNTLREIKRKYNRSKSVGRVFGLIGTALKTIIGWAALFMLLGGIFYLMGNETVSYVLFGIGAYVGFFALINAVSKNDKNKK